MPSTTPQWSPQINHLTESVQLISAVVLKPLRTHTSPSVNSRRSGAERRPLPLSWVSLRYDQQVSSLRWFAEEKGLICHCCQLELCVILGMILRRELIIECMNFLDSLIFSAWAFRDFPLLTLYRFKGKPSSGESHFVRWNPPWIRIPGMWRVISNGIICTKNCHLAVSQPLLLFLLKITGSVIKARWTWGSTAPLIEPLTLEILDLSSQSVLVARGCITPWPWLSASYDIIKCVHHDAV